jgi:DNA topoisomerase-1
MAAALLDRVIVDIGDAARKVGLRATGQTIAFDGFLKLYHEGRDDPAIDEDDEDGRILPPLAVGEPLAAQKVTPTQHFTEPPPRFTEASLVKKLEELGIGRPSTYAAIISVLQDRGYVKLEQKRFVPEDKGRLVTAFLVSYFDRWMQPGFTAELEDELDGVASGERLWKDVLRAWWPPFKGQIDEALGLERQAVLQALDTALAPSLFPAREDGGNPRTCPLCGNGGLSLKLSKFGPFIGCSNYPECRYTRPFGIDGGNGAADRPLGEDGGETVVLKAGRFGPYVQRGEGDAVKRVTLPRGMPADSVDLEKALKLLSLPRTLGTDPETGEPVLAGVGRYGPYLQVGKRYVSLKREDDVLEIGMNLALTRIAEAKEGAGRRGAGIEPLREVGKHPADGEPVQLFKGRFGPYVKHGKVNASLRKGMEAETLTLEQAVDLVAGKAAKPGKGKARPAAKAKPAAKAAAKAPAKAKSLAKAKPAAKAKAPAKATAKAPRRAAGG